MQSMLRTFLCVCALFPGAAFAEGNGDRLVLESGDVKATFSGELRTRHQIRTPASFALDNTTSATLMRMRFGVDVNLPEGHNLLLQFQDARSFGSEPTAAANTNDTFDVLQAYYYNRNLFDEGIEFYAGRQKFTVGNERLFSTLEWSQTSRAWDGLRAKKTFDNTWNLMGFALVVDGDSDAGTMFASEQRYNLGATLGCTGIEGHAAELFVLNDVRQGSGNGDGHTTFLSLRIDGKQFENRLAYSLEGIAQRGTTKGAADDTDIAAWAAFATLSYTLAVTDADNLIVMAGYDYASGDDDATDDSAQTFRAPYPFGHKYTGYADVLGYNNLHDIYGSLKYKSGASWTLEGALHKFLRAETADAAYNTTGAVVFAAGSSERDIGLEFDTVLDYTFDKWATMQAGWSHFFTGPFVEDVAVNDDDLDFIWLSLTAKF